MNRKFENLDELEAWCIERGAFGITEVLISEIKKKDEKIEKQQTRIDELTVKLGDLILQEGGK